MTTIKHKAFRTLRIALSLVAVLAGGGQQGGLDVVVQHIRIVGTRQWLGLVAGSLVAGAPVIAPLTERIVRALPGHADPAAESGAGPDAIA